MQITPNHSSTGAAASDSYFEESFKTCGSQKLLDYPPSNQQRRRARNALSRPMVSPAAPLSGVLASRRTKCDSAQSILTTSSSTTPRSPGSWPSTKSAAKSSPFACGTARDLWRQTHSAAAGPCGASETRGRPGSSVPLSLKSPSSRARSRMGCTTKPYIETIKTGRAQYLGFLISEA